MQPERVAPLQGVQNFRDFGGYRCADGALPFGRLYRSGHLGKATDADVVHLGGLGLCLVTDLRKPSERARDVSRLHPEFRGALLTSDLGPASHAPHMAFLEGDVTPDLALRVMRDFYRDAPFDEALTDLGRRWFPALAAAEGAALVHCAAGKDRTGVLVALTHAALGVHRDDVVADYMLTNDAVKLEQRLPELTRVMNQLYERDLPEAVIRNFLFVEPAYIESAFDAIEQAHGTVDRYLAEHLGVDGGVRERIAQRLLG